MIFANGLHIFKKTTYIAEKPLSKEWRSGLYWVEYFAFGALSQIEMLIEISVVLFKRNSSVEFLPLSATYNFVKTSKISYSEEA